MTRPQDAARRFVAMLPTALTAGHQVIYSPLISMMPLGQGIDLGGSEAVIFTSANGVSVAAETLATTGMPAYCLGQRTTSKARDAGWKAEFCGKTADELVTELLQRRPAGRLLHLRGEHSRGNVAERLNTAGLICREQVIYSQPLLTLTAEALAVLSASGDIVVPLFSPRTARQFADLCPNDANIHLIAMSEAVAEPLKLLNYKDLNVCKEPDVQAMAKLASAIVLRLNRVESGRSAQ